MSTNGENIISLPQAGEITSHNFLEGLTNAFAEFTDVWEFEKNMDKLIEEIN